MTGDCADCNHSAAYHDGETRRPCRAWNPDEDDNICACKGWKEGKPPAPTTPAPAPDTFDWTS